MKKSSIALIFVIAISGFYFYQKDQLGAPAPVILNTPKPASSAIVRNDRHELASFSASAMKSVAVASSDGKNPYSKKPNEEVVEFRVINGLAVAYGDTLLGKVPPDFDGNLGRSESPRVQFWDKPEIPYLINPALPDPQRVQRALDYFAQHTAVHFVAYDGQQKDALVFEPGDEECLSYLGRTGGMQPIRLVRGCGTQEILHEIMHALGFIHEQSRPDRDQFVDIIWPNIDEKYQSQFAIIPDSLIEAERDSPFDYRSVMMYRPTIFAVHPGQPTMQSKTATPISPVPEGLSDTDIARVNHLYGAGN